MMLRLTQFNSPSSILRSKRTPGIRLSFLASSSLSVIARNMSARNVARGSFLSGIFGTKDNQEDDEPVIEIPDFVDNAPTWEELEQLLAQKQAELGWTEPDLTNGPTSSQSLLRLFGSTGEPRVKLYRDRAAWCPYCHKVWLLLEEKRIPYKVEWINMRCYGDKPREFTAKVPSGMLPVIELDGHVVTESDVIMRLLDKEFPSRPMLPAEGTEARTRADTLLRLERMFFSAWLGWLTAEGGNQAMQKARFEDTLRRVDGALAESGGPFFLGNGVTMIDCTFAPMLERSVASLLYYKGYRIRGSGLYPHVDRWFEGMEQRDSYLGTKSDMYTHCHDLPPQLGGCGLEREGLPYAARIDGQDGRSWHLPLEPLDRDALEPHLPGENPAMDRFLAARRLIANRKAVVPFALRGVGQPGPRPVSAPLSDPTAVPGEAHRADGDAALRHVAHALLVGPEVKQSGPRKLTAVGGAEGAGRVGWAAAMSLGYLRDRVGVPRDMGLPQARQLRAHLNWFTDVLGGVHA